MRPQLDPDMRRPTAVETGRRPGRVAAQGRFAKQLLRTSLRGSLAQRGAFWMQVAFMAVNNLMYLVTWWVLFERFPSIGGWHLSDMIALYGTSAVGFGLFVTLAGGARDLAKAICDGDLDSYLTQPKSVVAQLVARRSYASGWGDVLSGLFLITASGYLSPVTAPWVALTAFCSGCIFVASAVVLHSVAFWLGSGNSVARMATEFLVLFCCYPESIFSGRLRWVFLTVAPAGWIAFWPLGRLREFAAGTSGWGTALAAGALLVAVTMAYGALALWVFGRGLRRYSSGNRIGLRVG